MVHTFRISYNNAHVLVAGERAILIDAGLEDDAATLLQQIEDAGINPSSIAAVIITHGHTDHAGGANPLKRTTRATLIAGEGDRSMLAAGHNDELCPTNGRARDDLAKHQATHYQGFEADLYISKPTSLRDLTGFDADVIPLAGHTPGSIGVVVGEWAVVGDLFRGAIVGSSAETHFYMCDLDDNLSDIEWLVDTYPNVQTYFTGHFGPISRDSVIDMIKERRTP